MRPLIPPFGRSIAALAVLSLASFAAVADGDDDHEANREGAYAIGSGATCRTRINRRSWGCPT